MDDWGRTTQGFLILLLLFPLATALEDCSGQLVLLEARDERQNVTAPGYPGNYTNNLDCNWRVVRGGGTTGTRFIVVEFPVLEEMFCLHERPGEMDIINVRTGNFNKNLTCSQESFLDATAINVKFTTDKKHVKPSFMMIYYTLDVMPKERCDLSGKVTNITKGTPLEIVLNFDVRHFKTMFQCMWLLRTDPGETIHVDITTLDFKGANVYCMGNKLQLFDGEDVFSPTLANLCGNPNEKMSVTSKGSSMLVLLQIKFTGLLPVYLDAKFIRGDEVDVSDDDFPVGAAVGGIVGGLVAAVVVILVIVFIVRCRQGGHRRSSSKASFPINRE